MIFFTAIGVTLTIIVIVGIILGLLYLSFEMMDISIGCSVFLLMSAIAIFIFVSLLFIQL